MELLMNYQWPGNVRELESAIERGVLLETSSVLQASNLPSGIIASSGKVRPKVAKYEKPDEIEIIPLEEIEKMALINALRITGKNIQQAAKALGINRATVYRKLEKYKLLDDR
jgi:two-component system response regulator HydG